jgi:hypothetical protein
MISLTCIMGKMGGVAPPLLPVLLDGKTIHDIFLAGSGGDIDLSIDNSQLGADLAPTLRTVTALDLHEGLRQLTHNPTLGGVVQRIGLIYAGGYENHPEVLGLMFDRGFSTPDDQSEGFQNVPREGCAIFLDSISAFRKADAAAIEEEVRFTTIHELGHVFNLEHINGPNFLACSEQEHPFGLDHYKFTSEHQKYLSFCSQKKCIQPGGSKYGDRDEIGNSFDPNANNAPVFGSGRSKLELKLSLTHKTFWYCEPVELEIEVRVPKNGGVQRIPDALDPGREEFAIWIEEPNGERRTYQSPKFFCGRPRRREISYRTPFRRDLSIFGQAGGYTFRKPGVHRIWATLRISKNLTLASNVQECELRAPSFGSREFTRLHPLLTRVGRMLYYRAGPDIDALTPAIEQIARLTRGSATAAASHYALGRAFAQRAERSPSAKKIHAKEGLKHFKKAVQIRELSAHAADRAENCIREMEKICDGRVTEPIV